jgi:hypothetical protein
VYWKSCGTEFAGVYALANAAVAAAAVGAAVWVAAVVGAAEPPQALTSRAATVQKVKKGARNLS